MTRASIIKVKPLPFARPGNLHLMDPVLTTPGARPLATNSQKDAVYVGFDLEQA